MRAGNRIDVSVERSSTPTISPKELPIERAGAKSSVRFTSNVVGSLFLVSDILCFVISAPIALLAYAMIRGSAIVPQVHLFAIALMLGSFLLIRSSRQTYRRTLFDPLDGYGTAAFDAGVSSLIASALIWQAGLVKDYSRGVAILMLLSVVVCLRLSQPILRKTIGWMAKRGQIQQRLALYGADAASIAYLRQLVASHQFQHLRFIGVADDRSSAEGTGDLPALGGLNNLCELARRRELDQVLINGSAFSTQRIAEIVEGMSAVCVDVSLISSDAIRLAPNYRVNLLGSLPVLTLWQRPFRDMNQVVKRSEDLIIGSIALILVSPVLLASALLVRLSSPGKILFVQPRMGFNNEMIHVYKFRTMYTAMSDLGGLQTTTKHDQRVTPLGRFLRKFSIDELPQLINVLNGSMSLVGPRPHATEMKVGDLFYHEAVRGYAGRHRVKPGITGLAQVSGLRGEVRTIERAKRRVELDKYYVDNWSLVLDLSIMLSTIRAVFFDRDAY